MDDETVLSDGTDGHYVKIVQTIDGRYMVLDNGYQRGGTVGTDGAGSMTFPSIESARSWWEENDNA